MWRFLSENCSSLSLMNISTFYIIAQEFPLARVWLNGGGSIVNHVFSECQARACLAQSIPKNSLSQTQTLRVLWGMTESIIRPAPSNLSFVQNQVSFLFEQIFKIEQTFFLSFRFDFSLAGAVRLIKLINIKLNYVLSTFSLSTNGQVKRTANDLSILLFLERRIDLVSSKFFRVSSFLLLTRPSMLGNELEYCSRGVKRWFTAFGAGTWDMKFVIKWQNCLWTGCGRFNDSAGRWMAFYGLGSADKCLKRFSHTQSLKLKIWLAGVCKMQIYFVKL